MKHLIVAASLLACVMPVMAGDVAVSVQVGQPNFYGRIDIGGFAQPSTVYAQPVIIERHVRDAPVMYLRVPPGHMKNWSKHCGAYHACGQRVYFVRDDWYNREVVTHYREQERGRGHGRGDEGRRDEGHGNGHDNGHGHGYDKH